MTRESIDLADLVLPEPDQRRQCPPDKDFMPFETAPGEPVPCFLPMGEDRIVRQTSSTHGPDGYITVDANIIAQIQSRLQQKLNASVDNFTFYEMDPCEGADTLLIVYGVTARAAKTALAQLRHDGRKASLLILKTLYPVPRNLIQKCLAGVKQAVVVEMNLGQYVREIERLAGSIPIRHYGQMNGELISPQQIAEATSS